MTTFTQIGAVGTTDNLEIAPHWLGVLILTVFAVVVIAIFIFMAKDFIMQVLSKRITTTATLASKFQEEYVNKRMYAGTQMIIFWKLRSRKDLQRKELLIILP